MADYFKERERDVNMRLREIRDTLPEFADEFFVGVEPQTTSLTRLGYAYDLRIFFDYLVKRVRPFRGMRAEDLTLADMEKITVTHLENFMEYLTLYEFDDKECVNGDRGKARKISTVRSFFKYYFNKDKLSSNARATSPSSLCCSARASA